MKLQSSNFDIMYMIRSYLRTVIFFGSTVLAMPSYLSQVLKPRPSGHLAHIPCSFGLFDPHKQGAVGVSNTIAS